MTVYTRHQTPPVAADPPGPAGLWMPWYTGLGEVCNPCPEVVECICGFINETLYVNVPTPFDDGTCSCASSAGTKQVDWKGKLTPTGAWWRTATPKPSVCKWVYGICADTQAISLLCSVGPVGGYSIYLRARTSLILYSSGWTGIYLDEDFTGTTWPELAANQWHFRAEWNIWIDALALVSPMPADWPNTCDLTPYTGLGLNQKYMIAYYFSQALSTTGDDPCQAAFDNEDGEIELQRYYIDAPSTWIGLPPEWLLTILEANKPCLWPTASIPTSLYVKKTP